MLSRINCEMQWGLKYIYFQAKYTPFITIPSPEENDQTDDLYYDDDDNSKIEYLETRPTEYVPPPSFILENQRPQTVIVRVENYIPLSHDTAQVTSLLNVKKKM